MNYQGAIFGLISFALFATHDLVIKFLGGSFSPFQLVFFASLFSFPLVTIMLMHDQTVGTLRPVHPWWSLARTIGSTLNAFLAFYAFTVLPLAEVYALLFATPLIITIIAIPLLGESVGVPRLMAVSAGLIGVVIVLNPGATEFTLGHLAALSSAFIGAFVSVVIRKISTDERTVVLMIHPLVSNFIIMGGFMIYYYEPMTLRELGGFGLISVLGFVAGIFLILAYKNASAAVVAPMQYSQIIWAAIFGYIFFNESIAPNTIIGTTIIILSGVYIVYRETRKGVSENTPVLRNRSRASSAASFRISPFLRRRK